MRDKENFTTETRQDLQNEHVLSLFLITRAVVQGNLTLRPLLHQRGKRGSFTARKPRL